MLKETEIATIDLAIIFTQGRNSLLWGTFLSVFIISD